MKWVKASDGLPNKDGIYHCRVKYFYKDEVVKNAVEFKCPFWIIFKDNYVIEWLDESVEHTEPVSDAIKFAEWCERNYNLVCNNWRYKNGLDGNPVKEGIFTTLQLYQLFKTPLP